MSMRKMLLCSGAALLVFFSSTALAVQPLEVRSVNVDFETNQIFIHGVNFLNGNDLEISLSDIGEINSVDVTSTLIVANFPVAGLPAGNYLLMVSTGGGSVRYDEMAITVGAVGPEGSQGEQGPIGMLGPMGPTGDTGAVGPQGPIGETGPTGPQGPQGVPGLQGDVGIQGPKGDTGDVGPKGVIGPMGATGLKGDTGSQGPIGMQGPVGATGPQGIPGLKGDTGSQGEQGLQGIPGPEGSIGPPGQDGGNGSNGANGLDGANCYDNITGGTSVEDCIGPQGAQGPPGPEGPQGETGPEGPPGNAEPPIPPVIGNVNLGEGLAIRQLAFGVELPLAQAGQQGSGPSPDPRFEPVVITIDNTGLSPSLRQAAASADDIGDVTIVYQDLQSFELLTLNLEGEVLVTGITDVPAKRTGDPSLIRLALSFGKIVITGTRGVSSWEWGATGDSGQSCSLPATLSFVNVANAPGLKEDIPILGYSFDMGLNLGEATGPSRDRTQTGDFAFARVFSRVVPETSCLFGDVFGATTKTVEIKDFESGGLEISKIALNTAKAVQFFFETDSRGEARITTGFDYETVVWTYTDEGNVTTTGGWNLGAGTSYEP